MHPIHAITLASLIAAVLFFILFRIARNSLKACRYVRDRNAEDYREQRSRASQLETDIAHFKRVASENARDYENKCEEVSNLRADLRELRNTVDERKKLFKVIIMTSLRGQPDSRNIHHVTDRVCSVSHMEEVDRHIVTEWFTEGGKAETIYMKSDVLGQITKVYRPFKKD